jgi:ADP-heptose:LPS heptosyltransferase
MTANEQVLIIKHGALGDFILATGPMKAIRRQHPEAEITLLTTPAFAGLFRTCPFIDRVETDSRPKWHQWKEWLKIARFFRDNHFSWVYDLQTSDRSSLYYRLIPKACGTRWSGIAPGASHRHHTPERTSLHTVERQKQQLAIAGITEVPAPDIDWMQADISAFALPERYALIVAGGSAHRPEKRWTVEGFRTLCHKLAAEGIHPVLIGSSAESDVLNAIQQDAAHVLNLCNQTNLMQIATLARHATLAVGNDTGPMHIAAAAGAPSVVLFSAASNPDLCAPRGKVAILRRDNLADMAVNEVLDAAKGLLTA